MKDSFTLATSYTIGSHILPGEPLENIQNRIGCSISLKTKTCKEIVKGIASKEIQLGLIESPIFDENLIYREWMQDELVVCSKEPFEQSLDRDIISNTHLVCRAKVSPTRELITDLLDDLDLSYQSFKSLFQVDNPTTLIQNIKYSKPNSNRVAILSKLAIEDELKKGELYATRIYDIPMIRKFYVVYDKDFNGAKYIDDIVDYLQNS